MPGRLFASNANSITMAFTQDAHRFARDVVHAAREPPPKEWP